MGLYANVTAAEGRAMSETRKIAAILIAEAERARGEAAAEPEALVRPVTIQNGDNSRS
jgi:hypothetical protein